MRTQGGYRFSLQFAADTEEQKRAGEFLERMRNRKSAIIVEALMTYLDANPKYESADIHIKTWRRSTTNTMDKNKVKSIKRPHLVSEATIQFMPMKPAVKTDYISLRMPALFVRSSPTLPSKKVKLSEYRTALLIAMKGYVSYSCSMIFKIPSIASHAIILVAIGYFSILCSISRR